MHRRLSIITLCLFQVTNFAEQLPQSSAGQRVQTVTSIEAPKEQPKQEVLSALRTIERDRVAKSAVPVLMLSNVRDFAERSITVEDMYYSAFFKDQTQSISIQGSRLTTEYPSLRRELNEGKRSIRSSQGFITESEAIWSASWNEFGAAYVLSVECAKPKDKRCESEDHLIKLTNSLVYVGGGKTAADNRPRILPDEAGATPTFSFNPPGQLLPGSGTGRSDNTVYSPNMRFPIENKPSFANSQVYNPGGNLGPPGGQCDAGNYSFPWWDNFCETRSRATPMCPTSKGHQGQDIRPPSCVKDKHFGVSATDGTVTHIGSYSVFITAADGTQYRYLHMSNLEVKVGNKVNKGNHIGRISNVFTAPTTIHLHFEIVQNVTGLGFVHVPPYMSLVTAYQKLP
jgi:murein DD-endopeptidase MepM/ murein hydrolase activator NlpD